MIENKNSDKTGFIYSEEFGKFKLPDDFPYEVDRNLKILEFCRQHGLLNKPWMFLIEAEKATINDLLLFHTPGYIEALQKIDRGEFQPEYLEMGLGSQDCPIFHSMFDYALIAAGSTLTALRAVMHDNFGVAFNPSGGLHHAGKEKAEGFCYINDIAIAIQEAKRLKPDIRICYADIDAHHPNGVQDAYYDTDTVLCISMHQTGRTIYPYRGFENEIGTGNGLGYTINVPIEPMSDDDIFKEGFDEIFIPAILKFNPHLLIVQLGVDMLHSDPLTNLNITSHSHAYAVKSFMSLGYPIVALGGGGYKRDTYIQTNALIWSTMNNLEDESDIRSLVGGVYLGDPGIQMAGFKEPRRYTIGEEKEKATSSLRKTIEYLKKNVPLLN